jgi:hypothetical protein
LAAAAAADAARRRMRAIVQRMRKAGTDNLAARRLSLPALPMEHALRAGTGLGPE